MTHVRTAALLVLLAALFVLPATASAASPELKLLQKVNDFRAKHGLAKVHLSHSLARSARSYSHHMMRTGYFGHARSIHASRRFRTLGEIIEWHRGTRPRPSLAFRDWLNSGPHRSVILMRQFRFAGAGYATGRFHGHRASIWTMQFGRR
jgi:uncharacterized protein YkwD